ncbi:UMP-CMP kinase 2, mitochondrial-like [Gigantopelta aegis]|uniref:UMP-CMP kinase 2, mitochondrial-like n=1 Tax=Gigantopelta aegis TaxID=1735272 RepID=UPI001B88D16E|nr:UMP-CMP kinase 2, mitochondrial-like [Gigantopelta aegis]
MSLYACFPQWSLYFQKAKLPRPGHIGVAGLPPIKCKQSESLSQIVKSNTVLLCVSYGKTTTKSYVESCLGLHNILTSHIPNIDFVLGAKVEPAEPILDERDPIQASVQRCLFALVSREDSPKAEPEFSKAVSEIKNLINSDGQIIISHLQPDDHLLGSFTKIPIDAPDEHPSDLEIVDQSPSSVSPIFHWTYCYPVYHTLERAFQVLHECEHFTEVRQLLKTAHQLIPPTFECEKLQREMVYPFVVVEGLDATGKTTLTETLEEKLHAAKYSTPPPSIMHLRKFFDGLPEIVRKAYYSLGNYIVAIEIAEVCKTRAVIMDRYWHSTTAYGIANETSCADLPPAGHNVYQWPEDLLKPTSILFLSVSESVRRKRLDQRGREMTREERWLGKDTFFRQRLCEAYRRMENPGCTEIDASGSVQDVMDAAVDILNKQNISLSGAKSSH